LKWSKCVCLRAGYGAVTAVLVAEVTKEEAFPSMLRDGALAASWKRWTCTASPNWCWARYAEVWWP